MTYTEKINLIHRYLSNELNPIERDEFNVWLKSEVSNKLLFDQISNIWEATTSQASDIKFDAEKAYLKHNRRMIKENVLLSEDNKVRNIESRYSFSRFQMIAAVMVLVIASVLVINFNKGEKINAQDTQLVIVDDGSKIWLEKGTQLKIIGVNKKERKVRLNGKAYFEIVENKAVPFQISTDEFSVKVMGTRFIVDSKGSSVNVRDGKVLVTAQKQQLILLADQSVNIKSDTPLVVTEQAFDNKDLWFNEELTFDNTPFDIVIRDLAINYKVSIELPNKSDWSACTITSGSLKKNSLDEVFTILKLTYDIEYNKTSDEAYRITRVKCK